MQYISKKTGNEVRCISVE